MSIAPCFRFGIFVSDLGEYSDEREALLGADDDATARLRNVDIV